MEGSPDPLTLWEQSQKTTDRNPYAYREIMHRLEEFDTRLRLKEIRVPTLVLAGGKDLQCPPSQAQIIAEGVLESILKVYDESGHGVIRHNPSGVVELVNEFVGSALQSRV